jgi:hypothetical protein
MAQQQQQFEEGDTEGSQGGACVRPSYGVKEKTQGRSIKISCYFTDRHLQIWIKETSAKYKAFSLDKALFSVLPAILRRLCSKFLCPCCLPLGSILL